MRKETVLAMAASSLFFISGCGNGDMRPGEKTEQAESVAAKEKRAFLESISGVYSFQGGGTVAINYADNNMLMAFDGEPYSVRLGDVDAKGETFNVLKRREASNVDDITTIRKVWNTEKTAFKLEWTFTDGKTADVTFIRKFSSDDARRIASIGAEQAANAQKLPALTPQESPAPAVVPAVAPPAQPQQASQPQPTARAEPTLSSVHSRCIERAGTSMPDMIQCGEDEASRQDARLNTAYKNAMSTATDKEALKSAQRQWIKARDAECAPEEDVSGGQAALLNAVDCIAIKSAIRAEELERMR